MKGYCKDTERLIPWEAGSGVLDYNQLIGAKVHVRRISGRAAWFSSGKKDFFIEDIKFRISTDGKCITIVELENCHETFTLGDLDIIAIRDVESS